MAGIDLGSTTPNLRSLVRNIAFEGTGDNGLFSPQQLDDLINVAHRELYNEALEWSPSLFAKRSADLTTDSTVAGKFDFSGTLLDAQGVHRIVFVEMKSTVGTYQPLRPINYIEGYWPGTAAALGSQLPYRYAVLGQTLMVNPEPAQPQTLRITYVPGVAALAATTDQPFGGSLQQFHDLVAKLAALYGLTKDKQPESLQKRYDVSHSIFQAYCRRRQAQRGRHVNQASGSYEDQWW